MLYLKTWFTNNIELWSKMYKVQFVFQGLNLVFGKLKGQNFVL